LVSGLVIVVASSSELEVVANGVKPRHGRDFEGDLLPTSFSSSGAYAFPAPEEVPDVVIATSNVVTRIR
jgi:hypothetical protein